MNPAAARRRMVEGQLRPHRVRDPRLLEAFARVPRELFAPPSERARAYADACVPCGRGRWLLEPRVLARMLEAARVGPADAALEAACGTGLGTAVLAGAAALAVGVESDPALAEAAEANLRRLELSNALVERGDPRAGAPGHAPYDVILVSAAVPGPVPALLEQLAEGGRLVAVERGASGVGRAVLRERSGGRLHARALFDASAPMLPEFEPAPGFAFA